MGGTVLIVNGKGRGSKAELLSLDIDNFCASIQVRARILLEMTKENGWIPPEILRDIPPSRRNPVIVSRSKKESTLLPVWTEWTMKIFVGVHPE